MKTTSVFVFSRIIGQFLPQQYALRFWEPEIELKIFFRPLSYLNTESERELGKYPKKNMIILIIYCRNRIEDNFTSLNESLDGQEGFLKE